MDEFDGLLRDALRSEVKGAAESLNGLEARIASELEGRLPRLSTLLTGLEG